MVTTQEIPFTSWRPYLDDFGRLYAGWRATITVQRMDVGEQVIADGAIFDGLSLEPRGTGAGDIHIAFTASRPGHPEEFQMHRIVRPWAVRTAMTEPGAEGDLQIESEDGTITLVRLYRPAQLPWGGAAEGSRWGRMGERRRARAYETASVRPVRSERFDLPWAANRADSVPGSAERTHEAGARRIPVERRSWPPDAAGVAGMTGVATGAGVGGMGAWGASGRRESAYREALPARAAVGSWWALALRGAVAVLLGLLVLAMPGMALLTLVYLFGFYAAADGVLNIVAAVRSAPDYAPRNQPRWLHAVRAVISFAAAGFAFFTPGITALALLMVISAWAVAMGVVEIVGAIRLRGHGVSGWMAAAGALSIILGGLLFLFPGAGALAMILWIGALLLIFGVFLLGAAVALWISGRGREGGWGRPMSAARGMT